jgi:C1A family cysteine protease
VRGVFGSIFACEANGRGSTPLHLTNLFVNLTSFLIFILTMSKYHFKHNRKYHVKKQKKDIRDYSFTKLAAEKTIPTISLPQSVNNRYYCSYVEDQLDLGSCTANAWAGLLQYNRCKNGFGGKLYRDVSRLFIYYNERVLEGTVNEDSGAELRSGAKTLIKDGTCNEGEWKYITSQFATKPSELCYSNAILNKIPSYYALNTLNDMKACLASGQCFVFGFLVFSSFETQRMADTGIMMMPNFRKEQLLGGHAVLAIGYDDVTQRVLCKNSWGKDWGIHEDNLGGYFWMPYSFISNTDLAWDFWTVPLK